MGSVGEAQAKLDALTAEFDSHFKLGAVRTGPIAPTGETYTEYLNGIAGFVFVDRTEGEHYFTADEAIQKWKDRIFQLITPAVGDSVLYWRCRPEIDFVQEFGWRTYCRFLISDKPQQESSHRTFYQDGYRFDTAHYPLTREI